MLRLRAFEIRLFWSRRAIRAEASALAASFVAGWLAMWLNRPLLVPYPALASLHFERRMLACGVTKPNHTQSLAQRSLTLLYSAWLISPLASGRIRICVSNRLQSHPLNLRIHYMLICTNTITYTTRPKHHAKHRSSKAYCSGPYPLSFYDGNS